MTLRLFEAAPVVGLLLSLACTTPAGSKPDVNHDARASDHPLQGRIWDVRGERFVDLAEVKQRARKAHYVLLGESHDHPEHHLLQAAFVQEIAASGRRPALGFEMLEVSQQAAVDAAVAAAPADPDAVAEAVQWARSGWPDFALYRPVFAAGMEAGLSLVATNLPREQARAAVREGPTALDPAVRERIEREGPYPKEVLDAMREEMAAAHCGHLPAGMLEPMVLAQRARDVQMAQRLMAADEGDGAVLIAGAGHVRADTGVPAILSRDAPGRSILGIVLLEVAPGARDPKAYAARWRGALPFDFVVFTPALERPDPCEQFKRAAAAAAHLGPSRCSPVPPAGSHRPVCVRAHRRHAAGGRLCV